MPGRKYFSYIRVSTVRQGQTGTSLDEQKAAIERHALRYGLEIIEEFEEQETAARRGRPVFDRLLRALRQGRASGVVMHKIDRSARNLKDWAELGELIDRGVEVHFASEQLDLYTRGGRLSADIQAVVAADYIRNLREEVKKGFYGRIRQGLFPMPAPAGYLDRGQGQPKEPDPVQGPLVRQAFELYAGGGWSHRALAGEMYCRGLRNRRGGRITRCGMAHLLHNPFYIGLIRISTTGETFPGVHRPLIPRSLFDRVQAVSTGNCVVRREQHFFLFRKLLNCASCGRWLIGERQKGYRYYRCQKKECPQKSVREELVTAGVQDLLNRLRFTGQENHYLRKRIRVMDEESGALRESRRRALQLRLEQVRTRLSKLIELYLEEALEKELYLEKKNSLLLEEQALKEKIAAADAGSDQAMRRMDGFLELANSACSGWKLANDEEKREMVEIVTSNLSVAGKNLIIRLNYPFEVVINRGGDSCGGPSRATHRTFRLLNGLLRQLGEYFRYNELSPLPHQENRSQCVINTT